MTLRRVLINLALCPLALAVNPAGASGDVSEILVRERTLKPSPSRDAYAITTLTSADLRSSVSPRLDEVLASVPGVSLFRRSTSRVAHPTTQGMSVRGIGPNGAGRTLVLLDGIPLNDPFGGWIYWSAVPATGIESVDIIRGGGSGTSGNAALAGTIALSSRALDGTAARFDASYGTKDTVNLSGDVQADLGGVALFAGGQFFRSDGYHTLRSDQRGPVDEPLASEAKAGRFGARWTIDEITTLTIRGEAFREERENGTPLAFNETRSYDASARLVREAADGDGFQLTVYGTDRKFENQFSSVNDTRTSETPALFQFDVPAKAWGATALARQTLALGGVIEAGMDVRLLEGETGERFFLAPDDVTFLRERVAGGKQTLAGAFVEYTTRPVPRVQMTGGVRFDYLRNHGGERTERALDTGDVLLDEAFTSRSHDVINGRLGLTYEASNDLTLRAAAYSGFRLPTINEFYRPFRVRNDITEANPDLEPERLYGVEGGFTYRIDPALAVEITGFASRLNNAVANVLITDQPGFNPDLGVFVPANGSLSQRRNLDRVRTLGMEVGINWQPDPAWSFNLDYLLTDSNVTVARAQPDLEGTRPPQVARHQASFNLTWTPASPFTARLGMRGETGQFDDPLNQRRISGYTALDLFVGYDIAEGAQLYMTGENLLDKEIEAGNASGGLITIGQPRLVSVGVRAVF